MNEILEIFLNNIIEFVIITAIPYLGMILGKFLNQLKSESLSREESLKNVLIEQLATTAVYALEKQIVGKRKGADKLSSAIDYIYDHLPSSWNISEDMIRKSIEEAFVKMESQLDLKGKK